ncbi:MAG TPA: cupin domain-containing protein [Woeseiaceae bacterium]|nr:cupin domain-containing protein [Woeseiaceae bacterium]
MNGRYGASEALARARGGDDGVYGVLLTGENLELGYYAPIGTDRQGPHTRDEIYVVRSGCGEFEIDGDSRPFRAGDALFVPAGVPHRFHRFGDDFAAWVVFFGPGADGDGS